MKSLSQSAPLRIAAAAVLPASLMLSACTVKGPNYSRPEVSLPATFRDATPTVASLADQPWWAVFQDPVLQSLIGQALANNYDLQVSLARIAQARAMVGVAESQGRPQVNYNAVIGGENTFTPSSGGPDTNAFGTIGGTLQASWEFDVWGRIARTTEAARASLMEQEEIRKGILLTLTADLAAGYFRLLELDQELANAQESVNVFGRSVGLFDQRFQAGRDSRLPVERARANVEAGNSRIQDLRRAIALEENAISVLMGAPPGPISRGKPLGQQTMPDAPVGATTDLLQRRPDIRAAEQTMVRANAEIGVAIANKFPKIGLSALAGVLGAWFSGGATDAFIVGNLGFGATGPLFDGGRLDEIYNNRKAFWDETVAQYRKTALVALRETSDALAAQNTLTGRRTAIERQIAALNQSSDLALTRYDGGRASYFEVLEAQQQLFPALDALAQTQRDQLLAVVNLYRALGGGWNLTEQQWNEPRQASVGAPAAGGGG